MKEKKSFDIHHIWNTIYFSTQCSSSICFRINHCSRTTSVTNLNVSRMSKNIIFSFFPFTSKIHFSSIQISGDFSPEIPKLCQLRNNIFLWCISFYSNVLKLRIFPNFASTTCWKDDCIFPIDEPIMTSERYSVR